MYMFRIQRGNFISTRFLFFSDSRISWINTHRNYIKNNISSNTHGIDLMHELRMDRVYYNETIVTNLLTKERGKY